MNEYDELIDTARRAGADVQLGGSGHWLIRTPAGMVSAAQSPSDSRAVANLRAELRRLGLLPRSGLTLTPDELAFLDQLGAGAVRCAKRPPKRLVGKGLVRCAVRHRPGQPDSWMVWITPAGEETLSRLIRTNGDH